MLYSIQDNSVKFVNHDIQIFDILTVFLVLFILPVTEKAVLKFLNILIEFSLSQF